MQKLCEVDNSMPHGMANSVIRRFQARTHVIVCIVRELLYPTDGKSVEHFPGKMQSMM